MLKNRSIKTKIILIVTVAMLLSSLLIATLSIYSIQKASDDRIQKYRVKAYQDIKDKLKKFSSIALSIIQYHYNLTNKEQMQNTLKDDIDTQVDYLFSILHGQYQIYKSKLSQEELKAMLMNIVRHTRYGKNGYFWINNFDYTMLMHPIKEELSGTSFLNNTDVAFIKLRAAIDELKESDDERMYMQYALYSPSDKRYLDKASTLRVFKPFNWIIGTGVYIDDFSHTMKTKTIQVIKELRYGDNGYFWINDMHHRMVMHPIKPEYDGKIFIDSPKVPFVELGVNKIQSTNKTSAFIKYKFFTPSTGLYSHKLSLVTHFKPWGWVIGTGTYTDYIEKHIQSLQAQTKAQVTLIVEEIVLLTLVIFLGLILFAMYLVERAIIKPLHNFRSALESFFHYLKDPTKKIEPICVKSHDEFGQMSANINHNIEASIETHREFSNMISTINQSVILTQTDEKGIITDASQAFCQLSGFSKDELIGQPHYVVRHPDMPRELYANLWQSIQAKKIWKGEIKNVKKDGSFYWVDTIISPKLTKEGKIYGYIAIRSDITEQKALQECKKKERLALSLIKKQNEI